MGAEDGGVPAGLVGPGGNSGSYPQDKGTPWETGLEVPKGGRETQGYPALPKAEPVVCVGVGVGPWEQRRWTGHEGGQT